MPPVADVEWRIRQDEVGTQVGNGFCVNVSPGALPRLKSMPRMARFIAASRQVVGLASRPKMATSPILPPCASMNSSLCTNMPPLPQQGS